MVASLGVHTSGQTGSADPGAAEAALRVGMKPIHTEGMPGRRLQRVLDHIRANLTGHLGVEDLARVAGMSPHYFSELFRRSVGRPPHQYVLMQRIERAKEALRNPKRSVFEAGLAAGFENPSHFARAFRRLVGATPRQFRAG
jgi:AraC family transcriptional regulator